MRLRAPFASEPTSPLENYTPFDISPDGKRFLMARLAEESKVPTMPVLFSEALMREVQRKVR